MFEYPVFVRSLKETLCCYCSQTAYTQLFAGYIYGHVQYNSITNTFVAYSTYHMGLQHISHGFTVNITWVYSTYHMGLQHISHGFTVHITWVYSTYHMGLILVGYSLILQHYYTRRLYSANVNYQVNCIHV